MQTWRVTAIRLEEKKRFISMFCRAVAIYQPQIYREIMLKNLPEGIEFSTSTPEALEMAISMYRLLFMLLRVSEPSPVYYCRFLLSWTLINGCLISEHLFCLYRWTLGWFCYCSRGSWGHGDWSETRRWLQHFNGSGGIWFEEISWWNFVRRHIWRWFADAELTKISVWCGRRMFKANTY